VSAISLILLATAAGSTAAGGAALYTARGLRRQLRALRGRLDAEHAARDAVGTPAAGVPHPRAGATAEEIRAVVVEALAEERERELAEARAFWAAQDARDGDTDDGALLAGHGTEYEIAPAPSGLDSALFDALLDGHLDDDVDGLRELRGRDVPGGGIFVPRQNSRDTEPALDRGTEPVPEETGATGEDAGGDTGAETEREHGQEYGRRHRPPHRHGDQPRDPEPPGLAAARRRHPSQPDFTLDGEPAGPAQAPSSAPAVADHERTVQRLSELALARTALTDVRQGPLGTLDVYLFEDGTTVCLSPGHKETAERLCAALRQGDVPVLMGGSSVSGAYALTFAYGEDRTAYLLADRVIASS